MIKFIMKDIIIMKKLKEVQAIFPSAEIENDDWGESITFTHDNHDFFIEENDGFNDFDFEVCHCEWDSIIFNCHTWQDVIEYIKKLKNHKIKSKTLSFDELCELENI